MYFSILRVPIIAISVSTFLPFCWCQFWQEASRTSLLITILLIILLKPDSFCAIVTIIWTHYATSVKTSLMELHPFFLTGFSVFQYVGLVFPRFTDDLPYTPPSGLPPLSTKMLLPMAINVHRALVDPRRISRMSSRMSEYRVLNRYSLQSA